MDLKVAIMSCILKTKGNYFVVVQLDELEFPSHNKKSIKYRTELIPQVAVPTFLKNVFTFENISFGSRITLKFGCFNSKLYTDTSDVMKLLENSGLTGNCVLTLTQRILTILREKPYEEEMKLFDKEKLEVGRITFNIQSRPHTFEQQLDEDIRKVEKLYYDPLENDEDIIALRIKEIEKVLKKKQIEMEEAMKKLDFIRSAHKSCSMDLANLQREKEAIETENLAYRKKIDKLNSLKELSIQIDILKTSESGVDILREKYSKLLARLNLERMSYEELSDEYFKIEAKVKEKKKLEKDIEIIKKASEEQDFHIKRHEDLLPRIREMKSSIKSQEKIIENIQGIIRDNIRNADIAGNKEIDVELQRLKHEHQILLEKNKQLNGLNEIFEGGELPLNQFQRLTKDEYLRDNPREVQIYKSKANLLLKAVEKISQEIQDMTIKNEVQKRYEDKIVNDPTKKFDKDMLIYQIEAQKQKGDIMEKEMLLMAKSYAQSIAELKQKIVNLDSLLAAKK